MSKLSPNSDTERGKRLEVFLKECFPEQSWLSRSQELGINNSTVIGWRQGREISNFGIARLVELGCDVLWLLTGAKPAAAVKEASSTDGDEAISLVSGILSDAIKNATEIRQLLDDAQNRVFEGRLSADEFEGITEDLLAALESSLTKRDKSRLTGAQAHDSGA